MLNWFDGVPDDALHISVLSIGEIRRGIDRLPDRRRRERLRIWLEHELPAWFGPRVLAIDLPVADRWGRLLATTERMRSIDSLIGATALHHGLRVVTRNVTYFQLPDLEVINPWDSE